MENNSTKKKAGWLSDLESKSWSLEMTISGAATFAVSFFPGLLERGLDYYMENLAPSESNFAVVFPVLSYSFFMVVAWVLLGFFVAHLCMRALWVGAVGLHSAFPAGIRYDQLPNMSDNFKKLAEEKYGSLEDYILRLDKRSNKMFALAFALAMGLSGLGIVYLLLFCVMLLMRNVLSPEAISSLGQILYGLIIVLSLALLISNWWMKRNPDKKRFGDKMARLQLAFGRVVNPFFSRALQYLSLTFMSNISRRSYYSGLVIILMLMVVSTIFVTVRKVSQWSGRTPAFERAFYSQGSQYFRLSNASYDALRPSEALLPEVSIPEDIVNDNFLPVFVKYPRFLDIRLHAFCGKLKISKDTLLSKTARFRLVDSLRINCLNEFFQLQINDSIQLQTTWLFTEKQGSKGLVTYLDTRNLPIGKNLLSVKIPTERKIDSLELYGSLYFWFSPESGALE